MTNESKTLTIKKKSLFGSASLDKRKARAGWIFVLPFALGLILVYFPIIIDSIWYSFSAIHYDNDGLIYTTFEGISFYSSALLEDTSYVQTLVAGIKDLVFDTPAIVIFSLFIAVILNQDMLGRAAFRAIFFVPVIIATGLMESINASDMLSSYMESGSMDNGSGQATNQIVSTVDIQNLFASMKIGTELVEYVTNLVNDIYNIVNRSGVQMLIFLAGLQSISPAIYEACEIEGATSWETFWKITFPMISPMILVNFVYTIIDAFTSESNVVMTYVGSVSDNSLASAMYWLYFVIIMAIIAIVAAIASCFVFYQKRD